jgi:hypothetical protein
MPGSELRAEAKTVELLGASLIERLVGRHVRSADKPISLIFSVVYGFPSDTGTSRAYLLRHPDA